MILQRVKKKYFRDNSKTSLRTFSIILNTWQDIALIGARGKETQ